MENLTLNEDILVYCITAASFPDGVKEAHESLHALIPFEEQRKYFGLSWPQTGRLSTKRQLKNCIPENCPGINWKP